MPIAMKTRTARSQAGLTLIEVLVAILIFSFGLLGFVGLQARAIQYSMSAEDSNRAALLANQIGAEMMMAGTVNLPASAVAAWQARASDASGGGLPNGRGDIAVAANVATVTVRWRAPGAASGALNSENRYVTQVILP
jgi:type IV pilus assembly protein PilV